MSRVVIIGNGIAGITAARHIRKRSDHQITVISAESDHFYSRTALMYIYMGHMKYQDTKPYEDGFWAANRIELLRAKVNSIDAGSRELSLEGGQTLAYDTLIIATGSKSNKFGWPGQDLDGVQGLYSLQDLESMERWTAGIDHAVVVGGGLIGIEMSEMLHSRGIHSSLLVREPSWMAHAYQPEESEMLNRVIRGHGIDYRVATEIESIEDDGSGRAAAVNLKGGGRIDCQFVGLTVGVSPNIGFLEGSGIECGRGVLVDNHLQSSQEGIYAIGDCVELRNPAPGRRSVEALWYMGRSMGEALARTICGETTDYVQDVWFNSAKFFDLEWQVYGQVPAVTPDGVESLYYEVSSGDRAIRINYRSSDRALLGINLMGVRYRHDLCDRWLRREAPIEEVLADLPAANFDPELYPEIERGLVELYNQRNPTNPVQFRRRRGIAGFLAALKAS